MEKTEKMELENKKKNLPLINWDLLPIKGHYFLFAFGLCPVLINIPIITRQKGFSSSVVGMLLTVSCLFGVLSRPIFGWLSDRYKLHKTIMMLMLGITSIGYFSMYLIPSFSSQINLINNKENGVEVRFCPKNPTWDNCLENRIERMTNKLIKCQLKCEIPNSKLNQEVGNSINQQYLDMDIILDVTTMQNETNCIVINELKNSNDRVLEFDEIECQAHCEDEFFKGTLADRDEIPDDEIIYKREFWEFSTILMIVTAARVVVFSMADTICFEALGENSHLFGKQRVWDSLGAGLSFLIAGFIIDLMSSSEVFKDYTVVYYMCLICHGLNILCVYKIKYIQPKKSENILKDVGKLLKSFKIMTFFIWVIFCGFFMSAIWNFLIWHIEELSDDIGQEKCGKNHLKTLEGIMVAIEAFIGEIPFLFSSGYIFKKVGHVNCMHLSFIAFAIRFFYYSVLKNPWWVLPIEAFNGLTYGLSQATMYSYANSIALSGTEATIQSLVGTLYEGVGFSLGGYVIGNLLHLYKGHTTFFLLGCTTVISLIAHVIVNRCFLRNRL